ncbi:hypothetical protein ACFOY2_16110 [Nonomuraea purpurea]|uniref:XRE family transcriptional regulator n=1 Tax=Nonomuraea purpurea TaxID=1849276 RepID=A0ABV8G8W1_9ACTN
MPKLLLTPIEIPLRAWRQPEVREALSRRDIRALLLLASQYGATQSRLSAATGMLQGRVSEIMRGTRQVTAFDVFERVAEGLAMPDEARILFGLAPRHPTGLDHLGPVGRAEIHHVFPSQSAASEDIRTAAKEADRIDVLAVRGLGLFGLKDSLLRHHLLNSKHARTLRILLLHPESEAAHQRAKEIDESHQSFAAGIRLAEDRLKELADQAPSLTIEVYRYTILPVWRLIALDDIYYVSAFGDVWEGHESAVYKVAPTPHGALHRGYRRMFDQLRASAQRMI